MFRRALVLFVFLLAGPPLAAQSEDNIIRLKLKPAGEPSPALKYQLLPDVPDQSPGNAALLYYRAFSPEWYSWRKQPKVYEKIEAAMTAPLADLARTDLGWVTNSGQLRELDLGARREYCDWDLTTRMRTEGIRLLLPDMQAFRELSKLLALRTRFYIADRQYDKAVTSLQTGMALARHIGEAPLLIGLLVAVSGAEGQLAEIETLIQAPGAPNLYWALTDLPRPFFDLRKPFGGEKLFLLAEMPLLKDIETVRFGPEQVKALAAQFEGSLRWDDNRSPRTQQGPLGLVALAIRTYPRAKKALAAEGWKAEDLEAMPTLQVVCIHSMREYLKVRDDVFKWVGLPAWQARPELQRVQNEMVARRSNLGPEPFIDLIAPGLQVCNATLRVERHVAALRTIEAIRLHAAANDGRLPATLADIHLVPVPDDPTTGKSFVYTVQGDQFTLTGPVPAGGESYQI
ncbi:MAG TPA: hypothetical protein VGP68_07715, partial [Gemmataceae bacterium]|nr:hypothetical protein [Gemmataceae bacterium]